jgi:hypothetical protein
VIGATAICMRPDIFMFRTAGTDAAKSTRLLIERLQWYFADQGFRGQDVTLHISGKDSPEQRCPKWAESLASVDARPADRFLVLVR